MENVKKDLRSFLDFVDGTQATDLTKEFEQHPSDLLEAVEEAFSHYSEWEESRRALAEKVITAMPSTLRQSPAGQRCLSVLCKAGVFVLSNEEARAMLKAAVQAGDFAVATHILQSNVSSPLEAITAEDIDAAYQSGQLAILDLLRPHLAKDKDPLRVALWTQGKFEVDHYLAFGRAEKPSKEYFDGIIFDLAVAKIPFSLEDLLARGLSVGVTNEDGIPLLSVLVMLGDLDKMEVLLKAGADIHQANAFKVTPMHIAAMLCRVPAMELLVRYGASVDAIDAEGATPLMRLCSDSLQGIKLILAEAIEDVIDNDKVLDGRALDAEVRRQVLATMDFLFAHGANPAIQSLRGNTALHLACHNIANNSSTVRLQIAGRVFLVRIFKIWSLLMTRLIEKNADIHVANGNGTTPLDILDKMGHLGDLYVEALTAYHASRDPVAKLFLFCSEGRLAPNPDVEAAIKEWLQDDAGSIHLRNFLDHPVLVYFLFQFPALVEEVLARWHRDPKQLPPMTTLALISTLNCTDLFPTPNAIKDAIQRMPAETRTKRLDHNIVLFDGEETPLRQAIPLLAKHLKAATPETETIHLRDAKRALSNTDPEEFAMVAAEESVAPHFKDILVLLNPRQLQAVIPQLQPQFFAEQLIPQQPIEQQHTLLAMATTQQKQAYLKAIPVPIDPMVLEFSNGLCDTFHQRCLDIVSKVDLQRPEQSETLIHDYRQLQADILESGMAFTLQREEIRIAAMKQALLSGDPDTTLEAEVNETMSAVQLILKVIQEQVQSLQNTLNTEVAAAIGVMKEREVPPEFYCPITQEIMVEPCIDLYGNTFERSAIETWLKDHNTSPMNNLPLTVEDLKPNDLLKQHIQAFFGPQLSIEKEKEIT